MKVDVSFGSMELYIPAGWRVVSSVSSSFGHDSEDGTPMKAEEDGPVLSISGDVSFGSLEIHYL